MIENMIVVLDEGLETAELADIMSCCFWSSTSLRW